MLTLPIVVRDADRPGRPPGVDGLIGNPWIAVALLGLFILFSMRPLKFNVRRHGITVSLVELPLLLALAYLPPLTILTIRVIAAACVQVVHRAGWVRGVFNVAAYATGAATSILIVFLSGIPGLAYGGASLEPSAWLVLALAVMSNTLITSAAVGAVMVVVQGASHLPQFLRTIAIAHVIAAVNATVGLIMLLAMSQNPWSVGLLGALAVVLAAVYQAYAQFSRQHTSLEEIHELAKVISSGSYDGTLADVVLGRLRSLMQAESATLWLPGRGRHPEVLLTATVDYPGLLDRALTPDTLRQRVVAQHKPVAVGPKLGDERMRRELAELGTKDAIVVPLRSGSTVVGTLEVAGRLGDLRHFGPDDVRLLETMAAHVAVAVENSRLVERLRFDAYHDALTSLPNRRRLLDALAESIKGRTAQEVVAVLQFDIVGLRSVNDSLGHRAGDRVLAEVARRLRTLAPPATLVARVGGDEFALVLRLADTESAVALGAEIREGLREPIPLDALAVDIDSSVGVSANPLHGDDPELLLQRADVAMYAAKLSGDGIQLYNPGLESRSVRRLGLAGDLRRALQSGEIEVWYQPQVALPDRRFVGVECLASWEHPVYGAVSPEDFVAVAEHTGHIQRLTEVVLTEGLRRARQWADAGRDLSVAVNLSPRTLADPGLPDLVSRLLDEHGVAADRLLLEIAETGVHGELERSLPVLDRLRDLGVRLAVDDFGTGQSSLAVLRRLPVHQVKIDRAFVQGMATDTGDRAIVRAVVDLSRHFGLSVVAEGVESELTLGLLTEMGCDFGQGFLFSRPLPAERLDAWIAAQTEAGPTQTGEVRWLRAVQ